VVGNGYAESSDGEFDYDRFVTAIAEGMSGEDWSAIARISFQDAGLYKAA
jgi:hypothetical protein